MVAVFFANWVVAALVAERIIAIKMPFLAKLCLTEKTVKYYAFILIIFANLTNVPYIFSQKVIQVPLSAIGKECSSEMFLELRMVLFAFSYGSTFLLPNVIEIIGITAISFILQRKSAVRRHKTRRARKNFRQELKTTRTVFILVIIRFLFTFPFLSSATFYVYYSNIYISSHTNVNLSGLLTKLFLNLSIIANVCNCLVYCFLSKSFRKLVIRF